jgi:regulatory protein YycI of two-component signal transduction system YycFG
MDWSRAKTILIFSFMFLNLILGYQLWTSRSVQLQAVVDASGALEEIKHLARSKNIELPRELPKDAPKLSEIVARVDENLKSDRQIPVQTPFPYNPLLNKGMTKDSQVKKTIPHFDAYQYDPVESREGVYVFHQLYETLSMFDVKLELFEQNGQIRAYKQTFVEVQSEGEQKEQKVIPMHIALRSLIENYLPNDSVITSMKLGYHGQVYNSTMMYMVPSWRVALANGDVYYIHALNGAVEVPLNNIK